MRSSENNGNVGHLPPRPYPCVVGTQMISGRRSDQSVSGCATKPRAGGAGGVSSGAGRPGDFGNAVTGEVSVSGETGDTMIESRRAELPGGVKIVEFL